MLCKTSGRRSIMAVPSPKEPDAYSFLKDIKLVRQVGIFVG